MYTSVTHWFVTVSRRARVGGMRGACHYQTGRSGEAGLISVFPSVRKLMTGFGQAVWTQIGHAIEALLVLAHVYFKSC